MIITSLHSISDMIARRAGDCLYFVKTPFRQNRIEALKKECQKAGIPLKAISEAEMRRSFHAPGASVALIVSPRKERSLVPFSEKELPALLGRHDLALLLDRVTDPHNLGAILRSCDMLGAPLIITPLKNSSALSNTVLQTSAGAAPHLDVVAASSLLRALETAKKAGYWAYCADISGPDIADTDFSEKSLIIVGNEGSGISAALAKAADGIFSIPTSGHIDSLNVSVAASIALYEVQRQRKSRCS